MKEHKISLTTAILLNMNILIGSGILIGPGKIAAIAGNASFLAWPVVALLFLPMVLAVVQLSRMFPGCGGFYAYAKEGLGETAGFLSGWMYVSGYTFSVALEILALREIIMATAGRTWLVENLVLFAALSLLLFITLNLMSFKYLSRLLNSLTIAKITPLIVLILLLPLVYTPSFTVSSTEFGLLPYSLPLAIFGFFGFEYCCSFSHLIEDGEKNAPRAILIGFGATAALYTLFHFGLLNVMGSSNLAADGAAAYAQFLPSSIAYIKTVLMLLIPLASILTIFAASNGMMNANAIMLQSMAQDKLFAGWSWLSLQNRYHRPWAALVLQALIAFGIAVTLADIQLIGNICNLGIVLAFLLPFISLLTLQRHRNIRGSSKFVSMLAILITVGFALYSWFLLGENTAIRATRALPLIALILVGFVLYKIEQRKKA
jgi:APA family basic amino acid/polyamine antiporter